MSAPALNLYSLPPTPVWRLIHSLLSRFLVGGGLEYEEPTGVIRCVDCRKFRRSLLEYVESKELDEALKWSFTPIVVDSSKCLGDRGSAEPIALVRSLILDSRFTVMDVFRELSQVSLKAGNETVIRWGSDKYQWLPAPPIVSSEGVFEVNCLVYALLVLGYASSIVASYGDTYLLMVPLTLNKELATRFSDSRSELYKLLSDNRIDPAKVPDYIYHLLIVSLIRAYPGAVELVLMRDPSKHGVSFMTELTIGLTDYRALIKSLVRNDPRRIFHRFLIRLVVDYLQGGDVTPIMETVRELHAMLFSVSPEEHMYRALRSIAQPGPSNAQEYEWAGKKLPEIIRDAYEFSRSLM